MTRTDCSFRRLPLYCLAFAAALWRPLALSADPWLAPGDSQLRSDLAALADAGVLQAPLTTWPLPWAEIAEDTAAASVMDLAAADLVALARVRDRARLETRVREWTVSVRATLAESPSVMRAFESTPRSGHELAGGFAITGERLAVRLNATRAWDPIDGDTVRLDGSYVGVSLGNWMLSAGYPERWWGPGWDGSLILSSNARPPPQLAINRNYSTPFRQRWLRWVGPWSVTSFMGQLDDERVIDDPLLFGVRVTAKPAPRFEVGLSRTAMFCGDGRTCDAETFARLLLGKDNRGVNVSDEEEPGNQIAGVDLRWALPFERVHSAFYMQWIGEDGRQGAGLVGSWLRETGVEFSGDIFDGRWRHRSHVELADTACQEGGTGFGGVKFGCGYSHSIYQTGYRYLNRSLGHGIDGDGVAVSVGSLLSNADKEWRLAARRAKLNRGGVNTGHTLAATPGTINELAVEHTRSLWIGTIRASVGVRRLHGEFDALFDDRSAFGWVEFVLN